MTGIPMQNNASPPHLVEGFAIAPAAVGVAAGLLFVAEPPFAIIAVYVATVVASIATILLGIPTYSALQAKNRVGWRVYVTRGFALGAVVGAVLIFPPILAPGTIYVTPTRSELARSGGIATALFGVLGAIAALTFWIVVRPDRGEALSRRSKLIVRSLLAVYWLGLAVPFAYGVTEKTLFPRDGRPKFSVEIHVPLATRFELRDAIKQFADDEALAFEDAGPRFPEAKGRPMFYVSAKKGDAFEVLAIGGNIDAVRLEDRISVFAYNPRPSPEFDGLKERLFRTLKSKWPDLVERPVP